MFSDIFIRRPILATVCSLVIILAGAIAIPTLPIARYPELAPPSVTVTAVLRINGQFFVYVATAEKGGLIAHQRQITVGNIVGNDYVVAGGLAAGDQVIVSGIQKIGDGAPVQIVPSAPAGGK